jgi:hypothetical protein
VRRTSSLVVLREELLGQNPVDPRAKKCEGA